MIFSLQTVSSVLLFNLSFSLFFLLIWVLNASVRGTSSSLPSLAGAADAADASIIFTAVNDVAVSTFTVVAADVNVISVFATATKYAS